jgi:hypothetical protein
MESGLPPQFALSRRSPNGARLAFIKAACAVAEGAHVVRDGAGSCVAAALDDPQCRVCVMGGRQGLPRSLGSVYAGSVVRFLGGFVGQQRRVVLMPGSLPVCGTVTVTRDGSLLLILGTFGFAFGLHVFRGADGVFLRTIGCEGGRDGPLQFRRPRQVNISPDDFVFVADSGNQRIVVLTPQFDFHGFVGVHRLASPSGVCADERRVFVSELSCCIKTFRRCDGAFVGRFGRFGAGDGQLWNPLGLCMIHKSHCVAVAEDKNNRISVFTLEGDFVRHVGVGKLTRPRTVACASLGDELVVADSDNCVCVSHTTGEILHTLQTGRFSSIAIHGDTIYELRAGKCVVLT